MIEKPVAYISGTLINEIRQTKTPGGDLVTNATIEFEMDGKTHRIPVKAWKEMATELGKMGVGNVVYLECSIEQERWRNKETKASHSRVCFVAEDFYDPEK